MTASRNIERVKFFGYVLLRIWSQIRTLQYGLACSSLLTGFVDSALWLVPFGSPSLFALSARDNVENAAEGNNQRLCRADGMLSASSNKE